MRILRLIALGWLASASLFAETPASSLPSAEQQIEKAFQREYAYLAAQREALSRQRQKLEARTVAEAGATRGSLRGLQAKLARLQADNDVLFTAVQEAERNRREERNREDRLAAVWKKAARSLEEHRRALRFEGGKPDIEPLPPEKLGVEDLARLGLEGIKLAETGSRLVRLRGTFLGPDERLVESTLFRLGRVAVFAETGAGVKLLGPDGKGALRVIESDVGGAAHGFLERNENGNVPVYLFESLQDRVAVRKPAGFADRVADLVPLAFLAMLFLMVAFLFGQLARS